jgi:hypothetical protein
LWVPSRHGSSMSDADRLDPDTYADNPLVAASETTQ